MKEDPPVGKAKILDFVPRSATDNTLARSPLSIGTSKIFDDLDDILILKRLDKWHYAQLKGVKEKRLLGGNPIFLVSLSFG